MVGESKDFRREIVENPAEYEETPLRDRKKVLYNFRMLGEITCTSAISELCTDQEV